MKSLTIFVLLASALVALGQDDGKYRPTETIAATTVIPRVFPTTTRVPGFRYNDPRAVDPRYGWNTGRWPTDRFDPRHDTSPRYDPRYNPSIGIGKPYTPRSYHDYRTIRLDEQVDNKGYRYVYETVGGILAEEVGTFENFGLKNEGVRAQGSVTIKDLEGVVFRIDYQTDSKDAYIPRAGEAPRTPPSIVKLLSLLESHK